MGSNQATVVPTSCRSPRINPRLFGDVHVKYMLTKYLPKMADTCDKPPIGGGTQCATPLFKIAETGDTTSINGDRPCAKPLFKMHI